MEEIDTDKRIVSFFTAFCLIIGALCLRLYSLCTKGTEYVVSATHYFTVDAGLVRGDIFDCRGRKAVNTEQNNIVVMKPTMKAFSAVEKLISQTTADVIKERMRNGNAQKISIGSSEIVPNTDAVMLKSFLRYSSVQPAAHLIGYIDSDGRGVSGIEKSFDSLLYTGKHLKVRFSADAYGRIISGAEMETLNQDVPVGSVTLTIDSDMQHITENSLNMYAVKEGGAVVAEIKTGAIRAMASRPTFEADKLSEYVNAENSPLVNRCLGAYAVGSVFKAAVAAAAIENGIENFEYVCTGSCEIDGVQFGCNNHTAHGKLNMQKALECSCNTYFINLAREIGAENLLETVKKFGFGQEVKLADGLTCKAGVLPTENELEKSGELANFSFGQGRFTASMLQMVQLFSAIANGGKYVTPYIIEATTAADGTRTKHKSKYPVVAVSESTSAKLTDMLVSVVENGNAKKAKPDGGFSAAGKTATAQTGTFYKNGVEICNTWFCGFFPADEPKYTVVILKQGGSSGAEDCAPVFREIADKISQLN